MVKTARYNVFVFVILNLIACIFTLMPALGMDAAEYHLGPQDKLKIRVYDWRIATGDAHEWSALTGVFAIGASGTLSLPIIGELPTENLTTARLSEILVKGLQDKLGLAHPPFASVEVEQYRPFYILGMVEKPGEYQYRPGMTVLQAVGIAGGMRRTAENNILAYEHEALVAHGDMRSLSTERDHLLIRQARIAAELAEADKIEWPQEVLPRAKEAALARAFREETALLQSYKLSLSTQAEILKQTKTILQQEIADLATKGTALGRQYESAKRELELVNGLATKGLVVTPRLVSVQQSEAGFESASLDVRLASLRAQEDISRGERDVIEYRNKARATVMMEAADVRLRLAAITEKMQTTQYLIYESEVRAPELLTAASDLERVKPVYFITRVAGGVQTEPKQVLESDAVLPGDTIRVERPVRTGEQPPR